MAFFRDSKLRLAGTSGDGGDSWTDWANLNPYAKSIVVQPLVYLFTSNTNNQDAKCYIRRDGENEWSMAMDFRP